MDVPGCCVSSIADGGCGSRTKKQTNEDVSMDSVGVTCSGVKTLQLEGVRVLGFRIMLVSI